MGELTDDKPKCLVEFRGKTLLEWQLVALRGAGISEIALVTGYRSDVLSGWGLREFHNAEWATTNMVSSLECASEWLEESHCIVSYSDLYYSSASVSALMQADGDIAVAYDPLWLDQWTRRFGDPLIDAETFRVDEEGAITDIGRRPLSLDEVNGQYMGLLGFRPAGWVLFSQMRRTLNVDDRHSMHMTGALGMLLEQRIVRGVAIDDEWYELDSISDILSVED